MIIIGTPEQIGAVLCGPQHHNEHTKGWRWHAYIGDTKARMRAVDEVARQMLAQSFQSAAELNITEPQKEALIKTLVLLETEQLEFIPVDENDEGDDITPAFCSKFNMRFWSYTEHSCGTVACIGGTAELIGNVAFRGWMDINGLNDLFWPARMSNEQITEITIPQAARALRSYLTTGDAKWSEAVAP